MANSSTCRAASPAVPLTAWGKGVIGAALLAASVLAAPSAEAAGKKFTIALIPGLTTDAFYITMRKGAEAAAKAVGDDSGVPGRARLQPGARRCRCSTP